MKSTLNIINLHGKEILPYLEEIGKLRIEIFHEYPYLYEGNMDYEKKYLKRYVDCDKSLAVLVFDNKKLVGASTALPLRHEIEEFKAPFKAKKYDLNQIFYLGESILLKLYRGLGIYPKFFNAREAAARKDGCRMSAFCAVERPNNHPLRPKDYHPLDPIWQRYGYQKHPELTVFLDWKETGEAEASPKKLTFWIKIL